VPEPEPRPSFTVPAVIVVAIALLAVAGVVFALARVESDARREATKPVPVVKQPPPERQAKPAALVSWPAGASAYTVALATASDEASARARATSTAASGIAAGVLDSDAYPTLEPGTWVVFTGRFDTREAAAEAAVRYAAEGFPDAQARFVGDARP
jgi:hypothetical protein